jgi:hypothetical protein
MDVSSAMLRRIRFLELLTRGYTSDCVSASEPFVTPIPRAVMAGSLPSGRNFEQNKDQK